MSNLIIAAHPDDEILGCGAYISKCKKKGINSYALILTDGAQGRYSPRQTAKLKKNAWEANKLAGTKSVFFEEFPNQRLDTAPLIRIIQVIEKHINRLNVDTLFTHHCSDLNKDHRIAYEASITAARPLSGQKIKKIYTYSVASSTEWNAMRNEDVFVPNIFIGIKDEIEDKIRAMRSYTSECQVFPHPRSPQAIRAYARYWGLCAGLEYAECFRLVREIIH